MGKPYPPRRRSKPRTAHQIGLALTELDTAARRGRMTRERHRRKSLPGRIEDITGAIERISARMGPVRSELGRCPFESSLEQMFGPQLRHVSAKAQRERKKLRKML